MIKAGVFDNFEQTRKTLIESFEEILDTVQDSTKKAYTGQVSMFDLGESGEQNIKHKYVFKESEEYSDKELLSMEKEMLGIYISGHPLEKLKQAILEQTNINTLKIKEITESLENGTVSEYQDGQLVSYAGIITSIKKKYTKKNTIMAFVTIEDLYGQAEIIVFENTYMNSQNSLLEENIVLVKGRLSIREDEEPKIVASSIENLSNVKKEKKLVLDIRNTDEETKAKLRGALRFFKGERNNLKVEIIDQEGTKPCGAILAIKDTVEQFQDILGKNRVIFDE